MGGAARGRTGQFGSRADHSARLELLAVTPISPFRPRRWPAATADFRELFNVVAVAIREDASTTVQLLFDADHSLDEQIIAEQFLS